MKKNYTSEMKNVVRMCTDVIRGPEISVYIHSSAQGLSRWISPEFWQRYVGWDINIVV